MRISAVSNAQPAWGIASVQRNCSLKNFAVSKPSCQKQMLERFYFPTAGDVYRIEK